jgi:pimeloyl-ACP methyl ester carboxylesterase
MVRNLALQFKGKVFASSNEYFQFMIDELGFPDILHFFESKLIPSGNVNINIDIHTVSKDAPTLIFVPGTSVYGLCYAEILHEIGKAGYNIIAIDPRGHGRSEGKRGDYTIEELMFDVETVVQYAKETFNQKVSLMGSSQGGIVCFYLAAKNIQVDSIICQNFADLAWEETNSIARYPKLAKMGKPLIRFLGKAFPNLTVSTLSYLDLKSIKVKYFGNLYNFIVEDPYAVSKISLRAARSLVNAPMAMPVENIKIPIFVFQGDSDIVFPVAYTQKLYNKLTCKKQMKLYPGCDHAIMVENVGLIKDDLIAWLNESYGTFITQETK